MIVKLSCLLTLCVTSVAATEECSICLDHLPTQRWWRPDLAYLQCGHKYHQGCLESWEHFGRKTCPLCSAGIVKSEGRFSRIVKSIKSNTLRVQEHLGSYRKQPEPCPICFEGLGNVDRRDATLQCGHRFHQQCLMRHLRSPFGRTGCPICRSQIEDVSSISNASSERPFARWMVPIVYSIHRVAILRLSYFNGAVPPAFSKVRVIVFLVSTTLTNAMYLCLVLRKFRGRLSPLDQAVFAVIAYVELSKLASRVVAIPWNSLDNTLKFTYTVALSGFGVSCAVMTMLAVGLKPVTLAQRLLRKRTRAEL
jgi:Ring finger domain